MSKRALSTEEIANIIRHIPTERDRALLTVGLNTGFRVSELLSLTAGDVLSGHVLKEYITISKDNMKGGKKSRTVVLNNKAKEALEKIVEGKKLSDLLFPVTKQHFWRVLKSACKLANIDPSSIGTHSMRKTFAQRVYRGLGNDIYATSVALGHANIATTVAYLGVEKESIDKVVLGF